MSNELAKKIDIGAFFVCKGMAEGCVWIGHHSGEGGDFRIEDLEAVIRKFYEERF